MPAEGTMGRVSTALVFAGGDPPATTALRDLPEVDVVIAADSGLAHARALGLAVDVVVGDLDSVTREDLDAAVAAGAAVERHPTAKDATDLELALLAARDRGAREIVVIGGHGGRLDHFLANLLLLGAPDLSGVHVSARVGDSTVTVVRDRAELAGVPGALCSLLPVGGPAEGVRTERLRFPLDRETLFPGSTRGVSNEFLTTTATVTLERGVLLAAVPRSGKDT
jgi:thiamine pyrophosphokinase